MKGEFTRHADVAIVGAGPAGALLSLLLSRKGYSVVLLEKQKTLERTFRGETVAASSVRILHDLGLLSEIRRRGCLEVEGMDMEEFGVKTFTLDYDRFPGKFKRPLDLPQPHLLEVLLNEAAQSPDFHLVTGADLAQLESNESGAVTGLTYLQDGTTHTVSSQLVIGADGRYSKSRTLSGLPFCKEKLKRDIIWFKIKKPAGFGERGVMRLRRNRHVFVIPTWPDLLRVGVNIPENGFRAFRQRGLDAFLDEVCSLVPELSESIRNDIKGWADLTLLDVFHAEAEKWARDGFLLIGDASYTVSPVLGQGVNLAMQDAVALANLLPPLLKDRGEPLRKECFDDYVAKRRAHKRHVFQYQLKQEENLAHETAAGVLFRFLKYTFFNQLPFKYQALERVLNHSAF